MKTFDLGLFSEKGKNNLVKGLEGKSYMDFSVQWGLGAGGYDVSLQTGYKAGDREILIFALAILAET